MESGYNCYSSVFPHRTGNNVKIITSDRSKKCENDMIEINREHEYRTQRTLTLRRLQLRHPLRDFW